jgi:hypothetical protein
MVCSSQARKPPEDRIAAAGIAAARSACDRAANRELVVMGEIVRAATAGTPAVVMHSCFARELIAAAAQNERNCSKGGPRVNGSPPDAAQLPVILACQAAHESKPFPVALQPESGSSSVAVP